MRETFDEIENRFSTWTFCSPTGAIQSLMSREGTRGQRTDAFAHIGPCRFFLPNAWAPTLVWTKLLYPSPPDRLSRSAKRWVTQVEVLQPRFSAVVLLFRQKTNKQNIYIYCNIQNTVYGTN